jgi:hypothetical protein
MESGFSPFTLLYGVFLAFKLLIKKFIKIGKVNFMGG